MISSQTKILDDNKVHQILNRIAYQIYENNFDEKEIILIGIARRGYLIAEMLTEKLKRVCSNEIHLAKIRINKDDPVGNVSELTMPVNKLKDKSVILVDDVLNSGRTLMYATAYIVDSPLKQLSTVVLVDRRHRRFPIKADFVGMTLSTTIQEHIDVQFDENGVTVFLH